MLDVAYPVVVRAAISLSTQGTDHMDPYLSIIPEYDGLVPLRYPSPHGGPAARPSFGQSQEDQHFQASCNSFLEQSLV